ncbi:MAG: Gfo/Idh/MocA family oxidoreductase [Deltaproteobacteria bacterium]|nr:Gfo/Idh/MocA family oxidoreductase [Deltaproteobacteria bacterium]
MKALVCGLGSMGKRRIRIMRERFPDFLICGVDLKKERQESVRDLVSRTDTDFFKAFKSFHPDVVFVCSPPLTNSEIVLFSLKNGVHTFSEINLTSNGYDEIIKLASRNNKLAFLSSTFLYNKEINWIIEQTRKESYVSYRYHTGQYLADWHPWEDISSFFISRKETNALREIMAIEFPWIFKAFGPVVDYKCMTCNLSKLNLEYPDLIHLILEHENGSSGALSFDCVSAKATRRLEIYNSTCFFEWGGTPGTLKKYHRGENKTEHVNLYKDIEKSHDYADFIIEEPYEKEVETFFKLIDGPGHLPVYRYEHDQVVIDLIDSIEKKYEFCQK